jgi:hypothetical protein
MGAKSNASTIGETAQDSQPTTVFEWKCTNCSYTNSEDMSRAVFGDTSEARQTCIMCYNLRVPLSDGDTLAKN